MRAYGVATALVLTLVAGGVASGVAVADDDTVPSRQDVRDARSAVREAADTVAGVRAQLVVANQRLEQSAVAAAQAAEAWNGARWRAAQAREAAREARAHSRIAATDVRRQQQAYGDALVASYQMAPELTALAAIVDADGIGAVVDQTTSLQNAERAMDATYQGFRAAATLAEVATDQAEEAEVDALDAAAEAKEAQAAAQAAADAAAADAAAIAQEKDALIARLAELSGVSVDLARERQSALEAEAAAAAAEAAQAQQAQQDEPTPTPAPQPPDPEPEPEPTPPPAPQPPAPAGGASAAIAFARAQLGEPYRWGAAGPSAWDCSGLTAGAWNAGGKYLPHYSVAQYQQSTPISAGQLQPGDLVFWGSSSDPSSIYHVALYTGNGTIIHAPRTGKPVTEESMYYWIPPNFYARP
ncbi:C40 family peptidase [Nocardioides pyridinolyticus]